jgi:hypothetical protein
MPQDLVMCVQHNAARRPVCRAFNQRLVELPDGELALVADIEVLDEETFATFGGYSVGLLGRSHRIGTGTLFCEIYLNARQFDLEATAREFTPLVPPGTAIDITEQHQKAYEDLVAIAVLVLSAKAVLSAAEATWTGFWNAYGAHLLQRTLSLKRTDSPTAPTQGQVILDAAPSRAKLILAFAPNVTQADFARLDMQILSKYLLALPNLQTVDRVVATVHPGPNLHIEFLVHLDGRLGDAPAPPPFA